MVTVKRFSLGVVQELQSQGYKWTKASTDRNKILDHAEDYTEAVVIHNTESGLFSLYSRGMKYPIKAKVGRYRVSGIEHRAGEVIVTPLEGEEFRFKDITRYPVQERPPEKEIPKEVEEEKVEPQPSTPAVEVAGPALQYQAKVTEEGPAYWKFGGKEEKKKKKEKPTVSGDDFYKTLEETGEPTKKEEGQTDLGELVAWIILGGGGTIGYLHALDQRTYPQLGRM